MKTNNKFWNMAVSEDGKTADLEITGIIVREESSLNGWFDEKIDGTSLQNFKNDLKGLGDVETINLDIDSPGGDYFVGLRIYNILNDHKAKINAKVTGTACSAASIIMAAADEISIFDTAYVMIHPVSTAIDGQFNAYELEDPVRYLKQFDEDLAGIYAGRTGKSKEEMLDLLKTEPYLNGTDAVEMGLCDKLISTTNKKKKKGACNHMPKEILNAARKPKEEAGAEPAVETEQPETPSTETPAPAAPGPDYVDKKVQDFQNQAVQASNELKRVNDLIQFGNDAGLDLKTITDAINNKKSAEKLAMEILISNKGRSQNSFMNAWQEDNAESGVQNIAGSPGAIEGKQEDPLLENIWKRTIEAAKKGE